jgi:hypothetical protein
MMTSWCGCCILWKKITQRTYKQWLVLQRDLLEHSHKAQVVVVRRYAMYACRRRGETSFFGLGCHPATSFLIGKSPLNTGRFVVPSRACSSFELRPLMIPFFRCTLLLGEPSDAPKTHIWYEGIIWNQPSQLTCL